MFEKRKESVEQPQEPTTPPPSHSSPTKINSRTTATIGESIKIKGDISGDENLVIEGSVEGQIALTNHDLTIGQAGIVSADLHAKSVKVHGQVTGDINGSEVVIVSKSGQVQGNITSPRVTLEDGAKFKGSIDMDPRGSNNSPASSGSASSGSTSGSSSTSELQVVDGH